MAKLLTIFVFLLTYGCALTAPEGTKELMEDIGRDRSIQRNQSEKFVGKPIFIKVRAYQRIEGANVYGKHWILMKTGNEQIDLDPLLNDLN
jgi:hypothetical protein